MLIKVGKMKQRGERKLEDRKIKPGTVKYPKNNDHILPFLTAPIVTHADIRELISPGSLSRQPSHAPLSSSRALP